MKAIILAAGQGTRLRPLTDDRPKCLVELAGKSLLDRQATVLRHAGIDDITVVGGYRADQIAARGYKTCINPRFESTNMVESLFAARAVMDETSDLLICYGDIVYEPRVLSSIMASDAPVTVMIDRAWKRYWSLRLDDPLTDAETLKVGQAGKLLELGKKPKDYGEIEGQYIGLIKLRADQIGTLKAFYDGLDRQARYDGKNFDNMYMTSFIQHQIDSGWDIRIAETENGWLEVDSVSDLALYHDMAAKGILAPFCNLKESE